MKYVEYTKKSKKEKKLINNAGRRLWSDYGLHSPISKIIPDKKKDNKKYCCRGSHADMSY